MSGRESHGHRLMNFTQNALRRGVNQSKAKNFKNLKKPSISTLLTCEFIFHVTNLK